MSVILIIAALIGFIWVMMYIPSVRNAALVLFGICAVLVGLIVIANYKPPQKPWEQNWSGYKNDPIVIPAVTVEPSRSDLKMETPWKPDPMPPLPPKIALSDLQLTNLVMTEHTKTETFSGSTYRMLDGFVYDGHGASKTFDGIVTNNSGTVAITHLLFEISLKDKDSGRIIGQASVWVGGNCGAFLVPPGQVRSFSTCRFTFDNTPPAGALVLGWRVTQINLDTAVQMEPVFPYEAPEFVAMVECTGIGSKLKNCCPKGYGYDRAKETCRLWDRIPLSNNPDRIRGGMTDEDIALAARLRAKVRGKE